MSQSDDGRGSQCRARDNPNELCVVGNPLAPHARKMNEIGWRSKDYLTEAVSAGTATMRMLRSCIEVKIGMIAS